jgi:hypothetical protein
MLTVKRTEITHYISGEELAWQRSDVKPKMNQAELARRLSALTGRTVVQQQISKWEDPTRLFGVDGVMLAALNEVLG